MRTAEPTTAPRENGDADKSDFVPSLQLCHSIENVGQLLDFCVAAEQTVDLTLFRSKALLVTHNMCIRIDLGNNLLCQISDRNFLTGSDIDLFYDGPVRFRDRNKSRSSVLYIVEISGRCQ